MKKTKRKASNLWGIAAVILLIGSLSLLLYPTVSKVINQQKANHVVSEFNEVIEKIEQKTETETYNSDSSSNAVSADGEDIIIQNTDYIVSNTEYS